MNRSVMERQMFRNGGAVYMQEGGMAPMPPSAAPGPEVMAGAMGGIDPNSVDINQAAQGAMQQGIDPAVLEGMLGQYAQQMDNLENAEDYETVINGIRGDDRPIEQRYDELATLVGPEDAQATPESVLALVQPVMLMAQVDQGIGGLAMEEMNAPVEGALAEGIMSTVNMGAEEPAQGMGGPAPVNFNQGGPVVYMQDGGSPLGGRLGEIYGQKQELYSSILSPQDSALELEEQTDLTKAQMLFDIAQGALMFATPGERRMSPAERLAQAFTPVLGNISARAGELQKFKQAQAREERALNLQALGAAETELSAEQGAAAKADLQREANKFAASESRLDRAHQITLKNMDFDFQNKDRMSQQEFTRQLQDLKFQNDVALLGLQGDQTQESIQLRAKLEQDNMRLGSELRIAENQLAFENQLQRDGILNTYELERMDKGHGFNLALASHKGAIAQEAQRFQNAFTAAEAALDRAQRENLQLSDQNFRQLMQEEMQKFTSDQAEIDRGIAKINRQFDNALATRRADQTDVQLGLAERAQILDEAYKLGKLAIDQLAANATKLGSESLTNTITYLTDPERLDKYANGTLGQGTTEFEQLVLDYVNPKNNEVWDAGAGRYVKGAPNKLAPRVLAAIQQGNPAFYEQVAKTMEIDATVDQSGAGTGTGTSPAPKQRTLSDYKAEIFNPDGSINNESEAWSATPPAIFDPNVDYKLVVGASRLFPGIGKAFSEGSAELFGGDASPKAKNMARAATSLEALANDLLQYNTSGPQGGRILKFVQELLEKETVNIRPGGFLFRTDADVSAALETIAGSLEQTLRRGRDMLPDYGGDSSNLKPSEVQQMGREMEEIKQLYNEVLAFQKAFEVEPFTRSSVVPGQDQSTMTAREQIMRMRRKR